MRDAIPWEVVGEMGKLILVLITVAFFVYDIQLRRRTLGETRARAGSALEVELCTSVYYRTSAGAQQANPVLETRVLMKNISSGVLAVPLVYLHARAAPETSEDEQVHTFSEWDFDSLRKCGPVSCPLNVARFKDTILYIPPGETESVVRWDAITEAFIRDNPLIVVKLEVFSAPDVVMGASYSLGSGRKRKKWLEFMEDEGGVRHKKVILSPAPKSIKRGPRKGGWAFLESKGEEIDQENSRLFRRLLAKISKTGRQRLVTLGNDFSRGQDILSLLGSAGTRETTKVGARKRRVAQAK